MSTKTQAIKSLKQGAKRRLRNLAMKSHIKTQIKRIRQQIEAKAEDLDIRLQQSLLDRAAGKGIIHKRQAARRKSRLARALKHS